MPESQISVLEGALRRGAEAVHDAKERTDSELRGIGGLVEELRGYWTGPAALAYTNMQNQFTEHSQKLNNVLLQLEDKLRATDRSQQATEAEHLDWAARLQGSI
ncbi:MAG: WXG100 family type VII secretion target [Bifidobacteriaceae bacterium]|jgi:WXG100 family type VII secretion target|nr:WXG100 family type VII secretion target [Bifidobacteriaceae bacterium]